MAKRPTPTSAGTPSPKKKASRLNGRKHNFEPRIENRKARFNYSISDTLECGIQLLGSEVKAVRLGLVSLNEGYAAVDAGKMSLLLRNVEIGVYPHAGPFAHDPRRPRRLLAHKREIERLLGQSSAKGTSIVPLAMYFVRGRIKVEIGVGVGKREFDKRQTIKNREADRELRRAMAKHL